MTDPTDPTDPIVPLAGEPDRGPLMAERVCREARAYGLDDEGVDLVRRAHDLAMAMRADLVPDDHHPMYLHPGRTVLVSLRDGEVRDPEALAAAALVDTRMHRGEATSDEVGRRLGERVRDFREAIPRPSDARVVEELVSATDSVRRVALSEQLDQLRHIRLWAEAPRALEVLDEAGRIYVPIADRTAEDLARRFRWLCARLERRSRT